MPEEDENEHMDDFVRHSADRVDYRLQRVSRRRTDPPVTGVRRNLFDLAFCVGTKRGLTTLSTQSFDGIRVTDHPGPLIPSVRFRGLQHAISTRAGSRIAAARASHGRLILQRPSLAVFVIVPHSLRFL